MNSSYKPLIVALFLGMAGLGIGVIHSQSSNLNKLSASAQSRVLVDVAQGAEISNAATLVENTPVALVGAAVNEESITPVTLPDSYPGDFFAENAIIQDAGQPIGQALTNRGLSSVVYTVKKGDVLSSIAAKFGVPASSIVTANPNISKKSLRAGQKITITTAAANNSVSSLPKFNSYFVLPAQGNNSGVLDASNAVEITNSCGSPVVAAADGVVVPDPNVSDALNGWNGGYGNFVLIEHAFGNEIYTRYTHLEKNLVQVGDYVKQGQEIGLMGQSGGASACQLGFEVIGAQNPFGQ